MDSSGCQDHKGDSANKKDKMTDEGEHQVSATFGLFAGDSDSEDDTKSESESKDSRKRARKDEETGQTQEMAKKMWEKRQRVWKHSMKEMEESSFLNSYALQDDVEDNNLSGQESATGEMSQAELKQYYDHYLKYYQAKYGVVTDSAEAKSSNVASALVAYDDSEGEES